MGIYLLYIGAGVTGFWSALTEGRKAGHHGTLVGFLVGLGVGFVCYLGMKAIMVGGLQFLKPLAKNHKRSQMVLGCIWAIVMFAWIFFSAFLGSWTAKLVCTLGT
jgi:NO-binding membrane sensor protein with MHYT domain